MDAPPCFGQFWDGIPESDCSKCRLSGDCLQKFAGETLRQLQSRSPEGPPERWAAEIGVSPQGIRLALDYQQRQELAAGTAPVALSSQPAEPLSLPPMPASEAPVTAEEAEDPLAPPSGKRRGRPLGAATKPAGKSKGKGKGKAKAEPKAAEEAAEAEDAARLAAPAGAPNLLPGEAIDFKKGAGKKARPKAEDAGNFSVAGAARPAAAPVRQQAGLVPNVEGLAGEPRRWLDPGVQKRWSPEYDLRRWERERQRNVWLARLPLGTLLEAQYQGQHYQTRIQRGRYVCRGWWFPTLYSLTKAITGVKDYTRRTPIGPLSKGAMKRTLTAWSANKFWGVKRMLAQRNFRAPPPPALGRSGKSCST